MAQKLWEKSVQVNKDIERFTKYRSVDKRRIGSPA